HADTHTSGRPPRLTVVGTGYLGATHAVCMATLGYQVLGVDVDAAKVEALVDGRVPFHEPGLPQALDEALASGRLDFTTDFVGTAARLRELVRTLSPAGEGLELAWNPEFLREGFAVQDTLRPDRLVFGVASAHAEQALRQVYDPLLEEGTPLIVADLPTSELV